MRQISSVWQRETPKSGRPCHPGAAEAGETPGATLSRVRDTPLTGVPGPNSPAEPTRVLGNQLRRGVLNSPVESAELEPVLCRQVREIGIRHFLRDLRFRVQGSQVVGNPFHAAFVAKFPQAPARLFHRVIERFPVAADAQKA